MRLKNKKTGKIEDVYSQQHDKGFYVGYGNKYYHVNAYYKTLSDFTEEWEDYQEPKEFWFIDDEGNIEVMGEEYEDCLDKMKEIGNYFDTREEAEKVVNKLKALKRLKDNGLEFVKWSGRKIDDGYIHLVVAGTLKYGKSEDDWKLIKQDLDLLFGGEE